MKCLGCPREIDPHNRQNLLEITGYVVQQRTGGGANHVIDKRQTGRILCADCAVRMRALGGGGLEQESLL